MQPTLAAQLGLLSVPALTLAGDGDWVAAAAIAVQAAWQDHTVSTPFLVIATGESCSRLPSFASTQRASHRLIAAYVLIDPHQPSRSEHDWPDAPVYVITSDADIDRVSRLRGWRVLASPGDGWTCEAILAAISSIVDGE